MSYRCRQPRIEPRNLYSVRGVINEEYSRHPRRWADLEYLVADDWNEEYSHHPKKWAELEYYVAADNWNELEDARPINPFKQLDYVAFDGMPGVFEYSSDFLGASATASPISLGDGSSLKAWESTNGQMEGDAQMWTMQNKMVNTSTTIPPSLRRLAFVRSGKQWINELVVDIGVAVDYLLISDIQNAGTRGDAQGTIPAIRFDGPIASGQHLLSLTVKHAGLLRLGIKTRVTSSGDESMFELDLQANDGLQSNQSNC